MFAVAYDDNEIIKINCTNEDELKNYKKVQTFSEGKIELIAYWDMVESDANRKKNEAKKMRVG